MFCSIQELRNKQIVSVETGSVIGFLNDIQIDTLSGKISNLIVFGKPKLFGFLGRENDLLVPWEHIEVIGEETILVKGPLNLLANGKYFKL